MSDTPQRLSRAFQSALGTLITNSTTARRVIAGDLDVGDLDAALNDADRWALETLAKGQSERVLAVADVMTDRRRHKVISRLPATLHVLGHKRFYTYWCEYLGAGILKGSPSAAAEAVAFTGWILCRIDARSVDAQIVRFESSLNHVLDRVILSAGCEPPKLAELDNDCLLRVSPCARIDRFEWSVDETMRDFLRTGEIVTPSERAPFELLFHAVPGAVPGAAVTRLLPGMHVIIERAKTGLPLASLLHDTPDDRRSHVRSVLERLLSMRVLEAGA